MNKTTWTIVGVIVIVAAVVVVGLASRGQEQPGASLQGFTWEWTSTKETLPANLSVVPDPSLYTITFNSDGTFSAKVDCNQVSGTYTASIGQIKLILGPSTLAECGPESLYNFFIARLAIVDGYSLQNGELSLTFGAGAGEMIFKSK